MVPQKEESVECSRSNSTLRPTGAQAGGKGGEGQPEKQRGPSGDSEAAVTPCAAGRGHPWSQAG